MSDDDAQDDDRPDDPFEQLEDGVGNREGDPFESLSDETTDQTDTEPPSPDDADWVDEFGVDSPTAGPGRESSQPPEESETEWEESETDGPRVETDTDSMTEMLGDVDHREGDPFEQGDLFEEQDTEGVDPDTVWEDLASSDSEDSEPADTGRQFAEVSKHSYCEQCEYFSSPPSVSCTHEGTDIVEFLDAETVRLVDCPIVAERRELENE